MTATSKTKPGTRKLSEVAKLVVQPSGITSTGWPAVLNLCTRKLGIGFDGWQDGAGRLILAKRDGGGLASQIGGVGMSLPRQVGKTYLIAAIVFALCILRPKLLVIWSAHHSTTHEETFLGMQAFAERVKIKPYIAQVFKGSGDEEIRFRNGSRILFGARERGFGRGIPGVDIIVSDEAQIMTEKAVDAQTATMNTSDFGLAIYVGTPPRPDDPSEAFTRMREQAWDGTLEDAIWIEVGADLGADPDDRRQWAKGNPSYPHRTPTESILRLRRKLTAESFMREALGVWDERSSLTVVDMGKWALLHDDPTVRPNPVALGIEVSPDREWTTIGLAGLRPDGRRYVQVVQAGRGTGWVVDRLLELQRTWKPAGIGIVSSGPAGSLLPAMEEKKLRRLVKMSPADDGRACGLFIDGVADDTITHDNGRLLYISLESARLARSGTSKVFAPPIGTPTDVSPLRACSNALYALAKNPKPTKTEARKAVVL